MKACFASEMRGVDKAASEIGGIPGRPIGPRVKLTQFTITRRMISEKVIVMMAR